MILTNSLAQILNPLLIQNQFTKFRCVVVRDDAGRPELFRGLPTGALVLEKRLAPSDPVLKPIWELLSPPWKGLSDQGKDLTIEKIHLYPPHESLLRSFLAGEPLRKEDEVPFFAAEYQFEREAWFVSLAKLYLELIPRDRPHVLILRKFHGASLALLRFLTVLQKESPVIPVVIVGIIEGPRNWKGPRLLDLWQEFLATAEKSQNLFRTLPRGIRPRRPTLTPNSFGPSGSKDLLNIIASAKTLFSFEDALPLLLAWKEVPKEFQGAYYFYLGEIRFLMDENDEALLHLNTSLEKQQGGKKKKLYLETLLLLVRIAALKKNRSQVQIFLNQAFQEAKKHFPDSLDDCLLHQVFFMDMIGDYELNMNVLDSFEGSLKEKGHQNRLSYIRSLIPLYNHTIRHSGWSSALELAQNVLESTRGYRNRYRESVMYHVLGYLHEFQGKNNQAMGYFLQGIGIREELGDPIELIKVYNGTGYFCFTTGDFSQALDFFSKALVLLESKKDFTETCLTLFNMAIVFFFSGHYEETLLLIQTILDVMHHLGYEFLPWHKTSKLYSLAGTAAWHQGNDPLALDLYKAMETEEVDTEALPYIFLFQGLTAVRNQDYQLAQSTLLNGLPLTQSKNQKFLRLQYLVELALLAQEVSDREREQEWSAAARKLSSEDSHPWARLWTDWRLAKSQGPNPAQIGQLGAETISLINSLRTTSVQEAANRSLLNKIREIQFLRQFQNNIQTNLSVSQIIKKAMEMIRVQFLPIKIQLWKETFSERVRLFSRGKTTGLKKPQPWSFSLKTGDESLKLDYYSQPSHASEVQEEEERILGLALSHLQLILDLRNTQEILDHAATIDPLTGTLSRREILERITQERRRCLRYASRESQFFTLLFIDLDNFKGYNDTFGHQAGDQVLKLFTSLLKENLREVDLLGRYGGDEFLILLPQTQLPGAQYLTDRLYAALAQRQGFTKELGEYLEKTIHLSPEKYLGCSIGLQVFHTKDPHEIDTLIQKADEKLYRAKNSGKGRMIY